MYDVKRIALIVCALATSMVAAQSVDAPGSGPGPGTRYATDAFPGFDTENDVIGPERKEPRWFQFLTGPYCETPSEQLAYCRSLEASEDWSKAIREYDALVRNWPTSTEAPDAQKRMAELLVEKEDDPSESIEEYKYLVDFYSFRCDYNATVDRMYEVAGLLREQGKRIVFFRFKNTVEVRRAFEACVLRAPGASWAPQAMLTIGELREEEGKDSLAVTVYENLRNLHYGTREAKVGVIREARVRMRLLRAHGYNRSRCTDTAAFLRLATGLVENEYVEEVEALLKEAESWLEEEAYRAACFYDSRMRTRRSTISAYEKFLSDYPQSVHADEIRSRLEQMKNKEVK